ncbi:DUF3795 domain-containing protein [Candidatus Bathyarchaeota archaeon]|nr:DUF3795 domain-containing protein [Candidatus Bathyarchaeota archaeon]
MKLKNSDKWVISVCGLNCAKCDIYEAGHGNEKARNEILEWFKKEQNQILKPEDIRCDGCRGSPENHWSSDCKMMLCAKKRGIQYCFQCRDFPCTLLKEFSSDGISHHKRTVENLKNVKEIGINVWIEEQKRKGKCVFCP